MNTDYAYAAGLFDGEGYVDIYKASTSNKSKSPSFMLRVLITQKDGKIMNWLVEKFKGYARLEKRHENYIHRWDIRSQQAKDFLKLIQPFVKIKKSQVDLAIEYEERKEKYTSTKGGLHGFKKLSDEEIKLRYEIREKLKKLKKEYAVYTKNGARTTTKREDTLTSDVIV